MYAPDPASHEIATVGGTIATNAGGLRCVKYGVTRDSVLGLTVVLADGSLLRTGRRTLKGVVGYDLTGLFVGAEGTLGVVVEATVRLLRLNEISGPGPGVPAGGWGAWLVEPTMPGVMGSLGPNTSRLIRSGVTPRAASAAPTSSMKGDGPQR